MQLHQMVQQVVLERAQARIADILEFSGLGGCKDFKIEGIIFPEDWDNSILQDIARISRIPDEIFLQIQGWKWDIRPADHVHWIMSGVRQPVPIKGPKKRRR